MHRVRRMGLALLAGVVAMAGLAPLVPTAPADAAVTGFNAGQIISDANFYASTSMTASSVQSFLNSKGSACSGSLCLKNYRTTTVAKSAQSGLCRGYAGGRRQTAAQIVVGIASSCGISPKVLLVTLQKETSLVTTTAPSTGRYRTAMGMGCPDTAACDAQYYGFFNQVYGAARQFMLYRKYPANYGYRAGRTNRIYYNPRTSCGYKNVYIANQATAGLYNYTPYVPNAAALAAGYGYGNSCSAYGNRNFYLFYRDWFGSPTSSTPTSLQRSTSTGKVYLVTSGSGSLRRYHVASPFVLSLISALGTVANVSESSVKAYPSGGEMTRGLVRDPANGSVYSTDGRAKHHFTSRSQMGHLGLTPEMAVNLTSAQLARFSTGAAMQAAVKVSGTTPVYLVQDKVAHRVQDRTTLYQVTGGIWPGIYQVQSSSDLASFRQGPWLRRISSLARPTGQSAAYVFEDGYRKIRLPNRGTATGLGFDADHIPQLSQSDLSGYPTSATFGMQVSCGGSTYVGVSGELVRLGSGSSTGLSQTAVSTRLCNAMRRASGTHTGPVLVRQGASAAVYWITGGKLRWLPNRSAVAAIGGSMGSVLSVPSVTFAALPKGPTYLASGAVFTLGSSPTLHAVTGTKHYVDVPSWSLAEELGFERADLVSKVSASSLDGRTDAARLSDVVACSGQVYVGSLGTLKPVANTDGIGVTPIAFDTAACARFTRSARAKDALSRPVVRQDGAADVYLISGGKKRHVTSAAKYATLTGGKRNAAAVSAQTLALFPTGQPY